MRHLDHVPEPTAEELAELEDDDADEDFVPLHPPIVKSAAYDSNLAEYEARNQMPDGESERDRMHRTARDQTRIENDTQWAFLSKGGSFLAPKAQREAARKEART